jgi:hypothetical protein
MLGSLSIVLTEIQFLFLIDLHGDVGVFSSSWCAIWMWGFDIFVTHDFCAHFLSHILQIWYKSVSMKDDWAYET